MSISKQNVLMRKALELALPYIREAAEPFMGYGMFPGGDPRNFSPDPENTPEEIAKHKAACGAWEKGEGKDEGSACKKIEGENGECLGFICGNGFGTGVYNLPNPEAEAVLAIVEEALKEVSENESSVKSEDAGE